jgi:hypothetical protein
VKSSGSLLAAAGIAQNYLVPADESRRIAETHRTRIFRLTKFESAWTKKGAQNKGLFQQGTVGAQNGRAPRH